MPFRPDKASTHLRTLPLALAWVAACLDSAGLGAAAPPASIWYKGAVHAHANWGAPQLPATSPDVVVRWYREHNYNFVSITDLNYYTPPEGLKALFDAPGRFLVVPGSEPSKDPIQPGNKIVDTIGIGIIVHESNYGCLKPRRGGRAPSGALGNRWPHT